MISNKESNTSAISSPASDGIEHPSALTEHEITVLLVDDQAMIGEAVRRMLADEKDIVFHFCSDPTQAMTMAANLSPTVILQDLVMPEIDGLTLVKFYRANAKTRDIPLIVLSTKEEPKVKAEAFALGANDYIVKLPDKIELIARIQYHSKGYINLLQRNEAYHALVESQRKLADELSQAAAYVKSLIPPPMDDEIKTDWRFIPSTSLGGDSFGYHWLDENYFAMYLLDVCGHGVGSALLSISVMNVLRSQSLPNTDFKKPAEVLSALNENFQMEKHNNLFFTIWYGVYDKLKRQIVYGTGGHPPAILLTGKTPETAKIVELKTKGLMIGGMPEATFEDGQSELDEYGKLYIFSDGAFEVFRPDKIILRFDDFVKQLVKPSDPGISNIDRILKFVRELQGSDDLEDDFSMVEINF